MLHLRTTYFDYETVTGIDGNYIDEIANGGMAKKIVAAATAFG
jgi:hypothetical protein